MRDEIKERLDKIEQGIVPGGYQKTGIGIIPADWEIKKLDKVSDRVNVGFVGTCEKYYVSEENGIPMLRTGNIQDKKICLANLKYVSTIFHGKNTKSHIMKNDLLLARHGSNGQTAIYEEEFISNCLNIIIITANSKKVNPVYLYYQINSQNTNRLIMKKVGGSTQKVINLGDIKPLELPIPHLQEQDKIANILTTWDKAIEKTEQLIQKKEIQKKRLMQKLLTGETRLPGFTREWQEAKLGDVSKIFDGVHQTPSYKEGGIPFISVENIKDIYATEKYVSKEFYKENYINSRKTIEKGDILMTRIGSIGVPFIIEKATEFAYYVTLALIKLTDDTIDSKFLYFNIQSVSFQRELYKRTLHVAYPNKINLGEINLAKFKFPPLSEQKAIAEILSTAEHEIELLNELLTNQKRQKKGLMQLLLTGIVRV